jgi:GGDEF domain-containing protein
MEPKEIKKSQTEKIPTEVEQDFDNKFGALKEANPDLYEELKREHLRQIENNTKLRSELKEALTDPTTGLEVRKELFKTMHAEIGAILGISNIDKADPEELRAILSGINPDDYKNFPLYVMMSDMSYLSLANKDGHKAGDALLASVGQATKKTLRGFRHGGDEITALIKLNYLDCKQAIKKYKKDVNDAKAPDVLKQYGLKPNVDVGVAHFSEGLKAFQELIKTPEGAEVLQKKDPLKELENLWLEIADKKTELEKGKARILLMMNLIKSSPEDFDDLYGFLNKGGYGIKPEELTELNEQLNQGKNINEIVFSFIKKREQAEKKAEEEFDKQKDKIINQIIKDESALEASRTAA